MFSHSSHVLVRARGLYLFPALLLATSRRQLEVSHGGRIYTVEIGRHVSELFSEEPLFNICQYITDQKSWIEYSRQCYS